MNTILYSQIIRNKVDTPVRKGKAKLVEILAKKSKGYWESNEVKIETGLINKEGEFFSISELSNVGGDGRIELGVPMEQGRKRPYEENKIFLTRMEGRKVEGPEGQELGRIYDYELYIEKHPWMVWKLMINPLGLSPLKRRVRIPTKKVKSINDKKLILQQDWKGGVL